MSKSAFFKNTKGNRVMKKIIMVLLLVANALFAVSLQTVKDFANGVSYTVFKAAWPTATYKNAEVLDYRSDNSSNYIVLKLKGNSKICAIGECPLWLDLKITTNQQFAIKNMEVLQHNAILQPPFQTSGAVAQAIVEANQKR